MTTAATPAHLTAEHPDVVALGDRGRTLVLDLVAELAADGIGLDVIERTLLLEAARHLDAVHRIETALAEGDLLVMGSTNQPRPSPLLDAADKAKRTVSQLLAKVAANRDALARAGRTGR